MKARKNELFWKVSSKYKWIHKLSSCFARSAKTDQEGAAWSKLLRCRACALIPEASRTVFQYSSMQQRLLPFSSVSW